jgi:hypothetical protein
MSFDLSIARQDTATGRTSFRISDVEVVDDALKLWHKYAVGFLTDPGSARFDPVLGSSFLQAMQQGRIRTEADVNNFFAVAAGETEFFIKSNQEDDVATSEELISSILDGSEVGEEGLELTVVITTADGEQRTVTLPVSTREELDNAD